MTLDRLIQPNESSAIRHLPEVSGWGSVRAFDPLENYEFWHPERFTGFLLATPEEPLTLSPLPASAATGSAAASSTAASNAAPAASQNAPPPAAVETTTP